MKQITSPMATLLAVAALANHASAQTETIVPLVAAMNEGNDLTSYPFGRLAFRMQQVFASPALASVSGTISAIAYRADNDNSSAKPAVTIPNVQIDLSTTSVDQSTMSTTFATNVTGATTTVFAGSVSLSAYAPTPGGIAPWGPSIPVTPYPFLVAAGNLLVDITATGTNASSGYTLDSALPGGVVRVIGQSGPTSDPFARLQTLVSANGATQGRFAALIPGGTVTLFAQSDTQPFPGQMMIGFTHVPAGIDLAFLNMPSNRLYVLPTISLPFAMSGAIRYQAPFPLAIPPVAGLTGTSLYAQCWVLDLAANIAGIVTSNAVEMMIGSMGDHPTRVVRATDPLAATGVYNYTSNIYGGAVVRFGGTFQ